MTPAIRSRVQIFELEPLSNTDIKVAIQGVLEDRERGFDFDVQLDDDALDFIATATNGDLRSAYNSLDLAVMSTQPSEGGERHVTRSEERRVGKECSEPCRSRWSPYH